jgi:hypothetical protein
MEGRVRSEQVESSEAATPGPKGNQRTRFHRLVTFPIPDYTKIKPKVDTWRENPETGGENEKVPVPDNKLRKKYKLESSPAPVPESNGKESPKRVHHPKKLASPPDNMSPKPASRSLKRDQPLRGSVEKPIHDPDHISHVPEVNASRMAPKKGSGKKKPQPQDSDNAGCGCFSCCRRKKTKKTSTVSDNELKNGEKSSQMRDGQAGKKRPGFHRLMTFPTPSYSNIQPKVNSWLRRPKTGDKDKKNANDA